jgi:hypothetical protein
VIGKRAVSPYLRGRTTKLGQGEDRYGRHIDEERAKWNE